MRRELGRLVRRELGRLVTAGLLLFAGFAVFVGAEHAWAGGT